MSTAAAVDREPLLELRGVRKVYGSGPAAFEALRGIDLTISYNFV